MHDNGRTIHERSECPATCFVVPPHVLADVGAQGGPESHAVAGQTLASSSALRARRDMTRSLLRELNLGIGDLSFLAPPKGEHLTIYDVRHGTSEDLPGRRARGAGDPAADDRAVNEAFEAAERTVRFYRDVYQRDSVDGHGIELVSSVHYGNDFDNAMWNGSQMIFGDGSGIIIARGTLTRAVDVVGHEITHGVIQSSAGLAYRKQSGALNESFADVFGSLVKQYGKGQTAEEADWLIGDGILGSALEGVALRSMEAPGTAHKLDRQPGHMRDYVDLPADNNPSNDNGGVHINSGIPNRAFVLLAMTLGGPAWDKAGRIWYDTLTGHLGPDSDFRAAGEATSHVAGDLFGSGSLEQRAVRAAWRAVGVL